MISARHLFRVPHYEQHVDIAVSVFSSFIAQHAEASGRIAGLAAAAEDEGEEHVDEFERLRRITESAEQEQED